MLVCLTVMRCLLALVALGLLSPTVSPLESTQQGKVGNQASVEINDDFGSDEVEKLKRFEKAVIKQYTGFFRTEEEQYQTMKRFAALHNNQIGSKGTFSAAERNCSFTCDVPAERPRRDADSGMALADSGMAHANSEPSHHRVKRAEYNVYFYNACCIGEVEYWSPDYVTDLMFNKKKLLHFGVYRQYFTYEKCTAEGVCGGCSCSVGYKYQSAVVLKNGVTTAKSLEDLEVVYVKLRGECKCFNSLSAK